MDRTYKINNICLGFHDDISKLLKILKESFPNHLNERIGNRYINKIQSDPGLISNDAPIVYF